MCLSLSAAIYQWPHNFYAFFVNCTYIGKPSLPCAVRLLWCMVESRYHFALYAFRGISFFTSNDLYICAMSLVLICCTFRTKCLSRLLPISLHLQVSAIIVYNSDIVSRYPRKTILWKREGIPPSRNILWYLSMVKLEYRLSLMLAIRDRA